MDRDDFDVIVVGCGIAGLSAAITAQENGARVAILERAPKDERGGNTRYTESFWRMKSEDAVSEDFEDRFAANAGGWPHPGFVRDAVRDREDQPAVLRALGMVAKFYCHHCRRGPESPKMVKGFRDQIRFSTA